MLLRKLLNHFQALVPALVPPAFISGLAAAAFLYTGLATAATPVQTVQSVAKQVR